MDSVFTITLVLFIITLNGGILANQINPFIIGGSEVTNRTECPYQVSVQYNNLHICGGVILDKLNILTAATCLNGISNTTNLSVKVGLLNLTDNTAQKVQVAMLVKHENYNQSQFRNNDIALLHLSTNLTMSTNVNSISMATNRPAVDAQCTIYGWGTITENGTLLNNALKKTSVKITNQSACNATYQGSLTDNMVCAYANQTGPCDGDVGSSMINNNKLVGITSFSIGCARNNTPSVYTDVTKFSAWIEKNKHKTSSAGIFIVNLFMIAGAIVFGQLSN